MDILYYVIAAAVIVIALAMVGIGIAIVLLFLEARKVLQVIGDTAQDIRHLKESFQSGMIGNVISFGKNLFKKKPQND